MSFLIVMCVLLWGMSFSIVAKAATSPEKLETRRIKLLLSMIFLATSVFFLYLATKESNEKALQEKTTTEEKTTHNQLLALPEGRYILDRIVSADSAKVRFTLQLPGVAKRKVEVIAYDDSPTVYWNEWQAKSAVPGDTLIICDVWNTDSTYSRVVQKMDVSQVGWGYLSFEWLERPGWRKR
jgi:hypothetical protein